MLAGAIELSSIKDHLGLKNSIECLRKRKYPGYLEFRLLDFSEISGGKSRFSHLEKLGLVSESDFSRTSRTDRCPTCPSEEARI